MKRVYKWLGTIVVSTILSGCLPLPWASAPDPTEPERFDEDAYRIGNLDGVLADNLNTRLQLKERDPNSGNGPTILAADVLAQLTAEEKQAIQSSYDAGFPIVLVEADSDAIAALHTLLGNESYEFDMPDGTTYVELYAIDKEDDGSLWEWVQYPPDEEETEDGEAVWTDDAGVEQTEQVPDEAVEVADNDDSQDIRVDALGQWLDENDHRWQTPSGLTAKQQVLAASTDQLTFIAKAFVKTASFQQQKNNYQISHFMWSCHSIDDGSDWFYIQQQCVFNASGNWDINQKPAAYTDSRMYYLGEVKINSAIEGYDNDVQNVTLIRSSPETENGSTEISSGLDYNIGGEVSTDGPKINGGISVHNSTTVRVQDCTVFNQCNTTGNNAQWDFVFARVGATGFWKNRLSMPPNLSVSTFQPFNQWIWNTSPDVRNKSAKMKVSLNVSLLRSHLDYYLVYHPVYTYESKFSGSCVVPLRFPPIK